MTLPPREFEVTPEWIDAVAQYANGQEAFSEYLSMALEDSAIINPYLRDAIERNRQCALEASEAQREICEIMLAEGCIGIQLSAINRKISVESAAPNSNGSPRIARMGAESFTEMMLAGDGQGSVYNPRVLAAANILQTAQSIALRLKPAVACCSSS